MHPTVRSAGVCSQCGKGWCAECLRHQGTAAICPECDVLCITPEKKESAERVAHQRRRPLSAELGTVLSYPLRDPLAYVMMAVFVGIFAAVAKIAMFGAIIGVIVSQGLLYAYAFTAINRVSAGDTTNFMPQIGDVWDLVKPVILGLAAMIVSRGPLILLSVVFGVSLLSMLPGATPYAPAVEAPAMNEDMQAYLEDQEMTPEQIAEMQEEYRENAADRGGSPSAGAAGTALATLIALPFALLWWLLYSPIALIAAAISQSFLATLNPITGIDAIRRMGSIYWQAWLVYTGIAIVGGIGSFILGLIPLAGAFLSAFVQAYVFLCFGCLLGFAVFKRAEELGLD